MEQGADLPALALFASHLHGGEVQPTRDVVQALGKVSGGMVLYQEGKQAVGNAKLGLCGHGDVQKVKGIPVKNRCVNQAKVSSVRQFT